MKSKKIKIIGLVMGIAILLLGGVVYFASTKLNPEEIRKIAIEQTQKIFPHATVKLEQVKIGWGLRFKVELQKFSLSTKDPAGSVVEMMAVDDLVVKIPLWAILSNGGVIEVQLNNPLLNYSEFPTGNNWTHSMGDKEIEKSKDGKTVDAASSSNESNERGSKFSHFFDKSKINIKLSNIAVKYQLRDNSNGQILISRFLVKGLNFESATAFEIASDSKFVMADKSQLTFSTIAIGEINISDLVKNGTVTSLVIVKNKNIAKTGLEWKFPEVTTNIDLLLKKDGEVSGKILTSFESQNKIGANFKITKQIEISDINVDVILKDIGGIVGLDRAIDISKAKLTAKGKILYSEDKKISTDLSFVIAPGIIYSKDGIVATTGIEGSYKEKEIVGRVKVETFNGVVDTVIAGEFDLNQKFDMKTLKPFDIKITAMKMNIPEKLIQEKLWAPVVPSAVQDENSQEEKEKKSEEESAEKSGEPKPALELPPTNISLNWSNINVGGEDFSGKGKIATSAHTIAIDDLVFKFSKGVGKLTQTMKLGSKSSDSAFDFSITDLNLSSFKPFLPPFVNNFSGTFSGKVNGSATMFKAVKPPRFDVNVIADAKKGEIKKLNISDYIKPLLENIPMVKDQIKDKELKIDGNFETLVMKGRFTNEEYAISSFNFVGINKKVEISGAGNIYPLPGASKLSMMDVMFTENGKIGEVLLKNVGSKTIPMRVSGPGFAMKPDYQFTISKVAKSAIKTKGTAAVQKILEKNIDKIIPEKAKEQVKGLIDGFFKRKK